MKYFMPCCRCNRMGSCKGCTCVKAGRNCLPSKLGSCVNCSYMRSGVQQLLIPINAPPATGPPVTTVATAVSTDYATTSIITASETCSLSTNSGVQQLSTLSTVSATNNARPAFIYCCLYRHCRYHPCLNCVRNI